MVSGCVESPMTPRARSLLAAMSAANLLQNLLFPVLAVRALGAGSAADALFMVFVLGAVVNVLLANSVLNWVTPRLVRRRDDESRRQLCWSLLWVLAAGVCLLCALLWLGAYRMVDSRTVGESYALAFTVLPLGFIAVLATVIASLAQCLFVAERDVPGGEWRALLGSTLALLAWFAAGPETLLACAALFTLRAVLMTVVVLPRLGKPRWLCRHDPDLRDILRESRVLLLAATYYKSEPFVDRLLFASAPGGAVAAYHLAGQILAVVTQLVQRVLIAPLIAPFAEAVNRADLPRMRRIIAGAMLRAVLLGVVVWVLVILAGEALLAMLLAGSSVSAAQIHLTAQMMTILGGFMLAVLVGMVSAQVYYCCGETRRVVVYSSAAYTVGLVMKIVALWQFGVMGLVVAVTVSWVLNVVWFGAKIPEIFRGIEQRGPVPAL
jgi:peptidoglycan biosynthesis protein MviN/MurJ (putative lipid II flippase)